MLCETFLWPIPSFTRKPKKKKKKTHGLNSVIGMLNRALEVIYLKYYANKDQLCSNPVNKNSILELFIVLVFTQKCYVAPLPKLVPITDSN